MIYQNIIDLNQYLRYISTKRTRKEFYNFGFNCEFLLNKKLDREKKKFFYLCKKNRLLIQTF